MSNRPWIKFPQLFPDFVVHRGMVVSDDASPTEISLPPQLRNAVWSRQADFVSGRRCAQEALRILGVKAADIPIGEDGNPAWPSDFVGSITHSNRLAFAAITWRSKAISLGIDIEKTMPLDTARQLAPLITTPSEYQRLRGELTDVQLLTTIVFSAKETIFKCLYPLVRRRFDFSEVEMVAVDTARGTFSFCLSPSISKFLPVTTHLVGQMAILDDFIHTAFLVPLTQAEDI